MKKVAIVTGAAGNGIGRSTALTLARDGFRVIVNYRSDAEKAAAICDYIRGNGGEATPVKADVFVREQCDFLISETLRIYGRIDVCIIGPGAGWNPEPPENLDVDKAMSDVVQEIEPVYSLVPHLIRSMKGEGGTIIGIASNPRMPSPSYSYNVAKNARIDALLALVNSCWRQNIRVNIVAPGPVDPFADFEKAKHALDNPNPEKITPQDIASAIVFLCSDSGNFVTGNVVKFAF